MAVYLDHAATTDVRPSALEAFVTASATGNPSSLHASGRGARRVLEEARESLAAGLGVRPGDVIFTSGATESDNIGIKGSFLKTGRNRVLVSPTEHHAVLDSVQWLGQQGAEVEWLQIDSDGVIDLTSLRRTLDSDAASIALVAVMWANNETGTIQPVEQLAQMCAEYQVVLHCDAAQAVGWLPSPGEWLAGPATLAISGHKFGAPIGIGALVAYQTTPTQLSHGGGQETDIRSGTVPVALAAALAQAFAEARADSKNDRINALRRELENSVLELIPQARINASGAERLPNISSITFPGCRSDALLMLLDAAGISCSAGSACTAGVPRPSHVLLAMGLDEADADASLRFSLGWTSTSEDIQALLAALPAAVERARQVRATVVGRA